MSVLLAKFYRAKQNYATVHLPKEVAELITYKHMDTLVAEFDPERKELKLRRLEDVVK